MADGIKGLPRLFRATRVSYVGLGWALRNEEAFRIEFCIFVLALPLALLVLHFHLERLLAHLLLALLHLYIGWRIAPLLPAAAAAALSAGS